MSDDISVNGLSFDEILRDVRTCRDILQRGLPVLVREGGESDSMIYDVVRELAEAVGRLDGAEGLLLTAREDGDA